MPKLKNYGPGRRVNIWLPEKHDAIASDIENLSQFFQIALEQAAAIMAFDIIKKEKGLVSPAPTAEQIAQWNHDHPLDPLTAKRKKEWPTIPNSPSNPALE